MPSIDLVPWLLAVIGLLIGALGFKSKAKAKEAEGKIKAVRRKKEVTNEVNSLDDDGVVAKFDELHKRRR